MHLLAELFALDGGADDRNFLEEGVKTFSITCQFFF